METKELYNELRDLLCNQDKALKDLVWTIARNRKLNRPKNALLIGELGSGKTTMVELTARKMGIPVVGMSGFFTPQGVEPMVLYNAFMGLFAENNQKGCQGIVLIHDMKDVFLYGGFTTLNSIITAGSFTYNNHVIDVKSTMFIGEIDNNGLEDCFTSNPIYTIDEIDKAIYPSVCSSDEVSEVISNIIDVYGGVTDEEVDSNMFNDQYREALKKTFLSPECSKVFNKKIFMDAIGFEDIKKALNSPVSELQTYSDDLCEEYISSPQFINSVAGHISESLVGLHDLDDAVRDVSRIDSKRKIKVYKENSLLKL